MEHFCERRRPPPLIPSLEAISSCRASCSRSSSASAFSCFDSEGSVTTSIGASEMVSMSTKGDDTASSFCVDHLFRMFASGGAVLVSLLAMFVSRFGVLLRIFVLAESW
jgi:hypothetical protein